MTPTHSPQLLTDRALYAFAAVAALLVAAGAPRPAAAAAPFKDLRMIIEYNSTAQDIGIQFFLDADGWRSIDIFAPTGAKMFSASPKGGCWHREAAPSSSWRASSRRSTSCRSTASSTASPRASTSSSARCWATAG